MKISVRLFPADDQEIAPGAVLRAENIPVTVGFDGNRIVGYATVFTDGSSDLEVEGLSPDFDATNEVGLGFRIEKERWENGRRIIDRLEPVTVGISEELFSRIRKGGA